jgi:hypothetical protein
VKIAKIITIVGIVVVVLGIIFHLQGTAALGPKSSFMYSNPEWVTHGIQISVSGAIMIGVGAGLRAIRKSSL